MDLLSELHQSGSTICMVTHDSRFAQYAQRTVHLFDGQIVAEDAGAIASSPSGMDHGRTASARSESKPLESASDRSDR
jgi:ABC-type lipoprotein export system ATPase subunit